MHRPQFTLNPVSILSFAACYAAAGWPPQVEALINLSPEETRAVYHPHSMLLAARSGTVGDGAVSLYVSNMNTEGKPLHHQIAGAIERPGLSP